MAGEITWTLVDNGGSNSGSTDSSQIALP